MKYVLLIFLLIFLGCNEKKSESHIHTIKKTAQQKDNNLKIIKELNLSFKNNKLIYPDKKMVLLFYKNNFYSKEEEKILKKLNIKFYKTDNKFLKKYFQIQYYPTIIILDKNKTIKFENFTPYEILKTERF